MFLPLIAVTLVPPAQHQAPFFSIKEGINYSQNKKIRVFFTYNQIHELKQKNKVTSSELCQLP